MTLSPFDLHLRTRVIFGNGALERLGAAAVELGFARTLLVADRGMAAAGYVARARTLLEAEGIAVAAFHDFEPNPDSAMVEAGRAAAAAVGADSLVALGGGSSLDCAKGINFLLAGGGTMRDYRGFGKARGRLLPSIGVPTTAGTGSEAQTYALISDAETHAKMACGDPGAAFRLAILDPALTATQPRSVTAIAGIDALSHAVESYVTAKRNPASDLFALEAWRMLSASFERVLDTPDDLEARGAMLLGAHWAGAAIECSMLGATHACANPLTARYGTTHGIAIAVMLPHVVRWNGEVVGGRYAHLCASRYGGQAQMLETAGLKRGDDDPPADRLGERLAALARAGGLPATLRELGASSADLPALAADAATQWTGTFNPRPFDAAAALSLYKRAL